jgi:hypothetical protein
MKQLNILFVFILFIIQNSKAQNPVAHYPLNGNAADVSGNNLNGIIVGFPSLVSDRFGNPNSAYEFTGNAANRIEIADNSLLRPTNLTITAWVKVTAQPSIGVFIDKALGSCSNDSWVLGTQGGSYSTWISNSSSCTLSFTQQSSPITLNQWQFVCLVVNDSTDTQELYVDGVMVSTSPITFSMLYDNNPLILGAANENTAPNFPFFGVLDDVKIYNSALTATQINLEYNSSLSINEFLKSNDFFIYPNPATELISIKNTGDLKINNADVFDINGRKVITINELQNKQIDISKLSKGVYFLQLQTEESLKNIKFIKE